MKEKNKKEAAEGAAIGALEASGRGRARTGVGTAEGRETGIRIGAGFVSGEAVRGERAEG